MTEIEKYNSCAEAIVYRKQFNTFKEAWDNCHRGDWMLWIAAKLGVNHRQLTLAKAYSAETVIRFMEDQRSIQAVKVAKRYGRGRATKEELRVAADAAAYAADTAYAAGAADAAYAAGAADAAAYVAVAAAYAAAHAAAHAAAYAAADAADQVARKANQMLTADICRKYLTDAVMAKIKALK